MPSDLIPLVDSPFAVLSFLAAPAILTNASTVLALGTSNRLARAADRARLLSTQLLTAPPNAATAIHNKDFSYAIRRARLLTQALRFFYLAAGSFAAGTCVSLLGAMAGYFEVTPLVRVGQALVMFTVVVGVGALVAGTLVLVHETRVALTVIGELELAMTTSPRAAASDR